MVGQRRGTKSKRAGYADGRRAGKEVAVRIGDAQLLRRKRFLRHRSHAQTAEPKARLIDYVRAESVSVRCRNQGLDDVQIAACANQLVIAVAQSRKVVIGLESRVRGVEVLETKRVFAAAEIIYVGVALVFAET